MIELFNNFVENVRIHGLEKIFKRYYSVYRAEVVSIKDNEKRGRVQLKVPSLFGNQPLVELAEPMDFRGGAKGRGEFFPPEVGDWVYVMFEGGDQRFPIYMGGWYAKGEVSSTFTHTGGVPDVRGYVSKYGHGLQYDQSNGKEKILLFTGGGHFLIMDDTAGKETLFLISSTGAQIQVDKDGSIKIISKDGATIAMDAKEGALTAVSKQGSLITMNEEVTISDSSGKTFVNLVDDKIQINTDKDAIINSNTASINTGSLTVDTILAKLKVGNGQVALGTPVIEVVDAIIQVIDALITTPSLCSTAVGPSGPLNPPASVQLIALKVLLTTIKGSV